MQGGQFSEFLDNNKLYIDFQNAYNKISKKNANHETEENTCNCSKSKRHILSERKFKYICEKSKKSNDKIKLITEEIKARQKETQNDYEPFSSDPQKNYFDEKEFEIENNMLIKTKNKATEAKNDSDLNYYSLVTQNKEIETPKKSYDTFMCSQFNNMKSKLTVTTSPNSLMKKTKEIIDKNHLYKIQNYFINNGIIDTLK